MTDLKLIDELLVELKTSENMPFDLLRRHSGVVDEALCRLRNAWQSDEMPMLTKSLADYFEGRK